MIELKNLSKIYKLKSGEVRALDDVSVRLPEKGMVFILGKSGSGKTTFLNVVGGLDNYSSGEVIIDGVSLADYKARDYDEYRNRYIGFVFQDYNLIDDFTAGENVDLALKLQDGNKSKDKVEETLEKVGLQGYYKRKINELSGGQKQRITIARALVKDPKIILADEPTGNLDSITATEVFDILKMLSRERLVLVVSHDRESAEKYADRIIELKDGKILSDSKEGGVTETETESSVAGSNGPDGGQSKKGRGYMPFSATLKYSFSNLWAKKIRVIASMICFILLLALCNVAYGTSAYDVYDRVYEAFKEQNAPAYFLAKDYYKFGYIETAYDGVGVPVYNDNGFAHYKCDDIKEPNGYYDSNSCQINCSMPIDENIVKELGFELVYGSLPQSCFEVCITKYTAESIFYYASEDFVETEGIEGIKDLVGKKIFDNERFTITGIVDTHIPQEFESLKSLVGEENYLENELYRKFEGLTGWSYYKAIMCHKDYFENFYIPINDNFTYIKDDILITIYKDLDANKINQLDLMNINYVSVAPYVSTDGVIVSSYDLRYFIEESGYGYLMTDYQTDTLRDIITDHEIYAEMYYCYDKKNDESSVNYHKKFRVIGFYDHTVYDDSYIFLSDSVVENMRNSIGCEVGFAIENENREKVNAVLNETHLIIGNESELTLKNKDSEVIAKEYSSAMQWKYIAGAATGVFIAIVIILMLNYFFSTIKDKTSEIGVLRAIGVRQSNIVAIFVVEALIISLVSYLISLPIGFYMADWLEKTATNSMVYNKPDYVVHFVMVGFKSSMITLGVCLGVALAGSLLPFLKLARLKPMEIIRKK